MSPTALGHTHLAPLVSPQGINAARVGPLAVLGDDYAKFQHERLAKFAGKK